MAFAHPPRVARKPAAADQHANVFSVEGTAANTAFSLPQVRLVNPTAARRINKVLVQHFNAVNGDTLVCTARQAVRSAEAMFRENNKQGFRGYEFQVLYNAHGVLSLELAITELSEHEQVTGSHITFDLRTGRQFSLADFIFDTTALKRKWNQQVNESTEESVTSAKKYFAQDSASFTYFKQRVGWDDSRQASTLHAAVEFAFTADGLSLFCHHDLPLPWNELQPQEEYPFGWEELRLWWRKTGTWRGLIRYGLNKKH